MTAYIGKQVGNSSRMALNPKSFHFFIYLLLISFLPTYRQQVVPLNISLVNFTVGHKTPVASDSDKIIYCVLCGFSNHMPLCHRYESEMNLIEQEICHLYKNVLGVNYLKISKK